METKREQFDELIKLLKDEPEIIISHGRKLHLAREYLKEMFPQFSTPKFRKCDLFQRVESGGDVPQCRKLIDTTQFQIVADDEGFYIVEETGAVHSFKSNGKHITDAQAQQILEYLKGE